MKYKPWIVRIVKFPPKGYFPRKFHYQREAYALRDQVRANGGEAIVERNK